MIRTIDLMNCIVYFVFRPIRDIDVELTNYISLFGHLDEMMSTILQTEGLTCGVQKSLSLVM